jgi:membrane associated rhomboid family serine protease
MEQASRPRFAALTEAPVAAAIVAVNVAVMAWVSWRFDDVTSTQALLAGGALERGHVWAGQWWRLVTSIFLHVGVVHLLANSLFGFSWCRVVERMLGHGRFLALYLLAGVGASATSLLFHDVLSAGASGALFGMIGATLAIHRRLLPGWGPFLKSRMTLSVAGQLTAWTVLALSVDLPFDHAAHGGGLVVGALATWLMTRPSPRRTAAWLPLGLALAALVAAAVWPRPGLTTLARGEAATAAWSAAKEAVQKEDGPGVTRALRQLDALGLHSDELEYLRAVDAFFRDDLTLATSLAQRLLHEPGAGRLHQSAAVLLANVGFRLYAGDGVPVDAERGYALIKEACEAGVEAACRSERAIRTGEPPRP